MSSLEDKVAYFSQLDDLVAVDNDELGDEEILRRETSRAFFAPKNKQPLVPAAKPTIAGLPQSLRRIVSAPVAATSPRPEIIEATPQSRIRKPITRPLTVSSPFIQDTPLPGATRQNPITLPRSSTTPFPSSPGASGASPTVKPAAKRKRSSKDNAVRPEEQFFFGLSFFYVPNNDVAPVRKRRIQRAIEHGATWVRNSVDATHVIVDKNLRYKDVEGILGFTAAEKGQFIVNENFPLDCISWKRMLNPDQEKYKVQGCPLLLGSPPPAPAIEKEIENPRSSPKSLPLKEPQRIPARWDYVSPGDTPPRGAEGIDSASTESEPRALHAGASQYASMQETSSNAPPDTGKEPRPVSQEGVGASRGDPTSRSLRRGSDGQEDELSKFIELAKEYQGPPLDSDAETSKLDGDIQEIGSESESLPEDGPSDQPMRKKRKTPNAKDGSKRLSTEDRFVCHQGGTRDQAKTSNNPNARTIEILQSMCDYYERTGDQWRHLSYRKVITILKAQTVKITSLAQAKALPGVGGRLADKIVEIVNTDKLEKLENAKNDPHIKVLELFMGIYDVGNSRASKWIAQGFRTLDDLRETADLTANQRLGLDHYDDLNTRLPRAEMDALAAYVKREAAKVDRHVELLIGGSYRRGSTSSGDIDFIVTKKNTSSPGELIPFLTQLVESLTQQCFLTAALASSLHSRRGKDGPGSKWHGCCVLPRITGGFNDNDQYRPTWRRIDFLLVPETEYGAALIYFTGNDIFNRSLRLLASKKGMRLNQRGLYKDAMRGPNRAMATEGELLEGKDEKRIFEILGVKWREPEERWC